MERDRGKERGGGREGKKEREEEEREGKMTDGGRGIESGMNGE